MSRIYKTLRLKLIPEFRVEIEEAPVIRILTGPAKASCYYNEKLCGQDYINGDVQSYSNELLEFIHFVDQKVSVTAKTYREMYNLLQNGEASRVFKDICRLRVSVLAGMLFFRGQYEGRFAKYDGSYSFVFTSSYPSKPSYRKEYTSSEGWALMCLIHLYFLVTIKERLRRGNIGPINEIIDSYLRSDILRLSKNYGFIEINNLDGSLESLSDIF
ncbi:MAG: hypothetical protein IKX20_09680 [Paludibacteraceae bacterium]|nr:hypothetical protein [Paludibacteraceae bacterium]